MLKLRPPGTPRCARIWRRGLYWPRPRLCPCKEVCAQDPGALSRARSKGQPPPGPERGRRAHQPCGHPTAKGGSTSAVDAPWPVALCRGDPALLHGTPRVRASGRGSGPQGKGRGEGQGLSARVRARVGVRVGVRIRVRVRTRVRMRVGPQCKGQGLGAGGRAPHDFQLLSGAAAQGRGPLPHTPSWSPDSEHGPNARVHTAGLSTSPRPRSPRVLPRPPQLSPARDPTEPYCSTGFDPSTLNAGLSSPDGKGGARDPTRRGLSFTAGEHRTGQDSGGHSG